MHSIKSGGHFIAAIFICMLSSPLFGQQPGQPVLFSNGKFITGNNMRQPGFKKEDLRTAGFGKQYFVVVQFASLPSELMQENLKKNGLVLHTYLPGKAYLATINPGFDFSLAATFNIASINAVPSFYKTDRAFLSYKHAADKNNQQKIAVSFYPTVDKKIVVQQLQQAGAVISLTKYDEGPVVFIGRINQ